MRLTRKDKVGKERKGEKREGEKRVGEERAGTVRRYGSQKEDEKERRA